MEGSSGEPSASGESGDQYLVHKVSKDDNMAGVAIRYGVTVLDLKQANGLLSDNAMFARDTLLVPLERRREVRISDANTVARLVNRLGRRADHTDFVSRPGTTALGPIASGPISLEESVTTPTSTAASSDSDSREFCWRDPAEVEMKVMSDIVMPSRRKDGRIRRDSMRQRTPSSRNSDRPASCSPRMESQPDQEAGGSWTGDRPCSPSRSEISRVFTRSSSRSGQSMKRSRPPNLPNGRKASQLAGYLVSVAHSLVASGSDCAAGSAFLSGGEGSNGQTSESILQRVKRAVKQSGLGTGSVLHLTSLADPLASSFASLRSLSTSNGRTPSGGGSVRGGVAVAKGDKKSD
ncbi:unnamed protein product [Ostreobium quekettii]|uniref:LysM domain-containing protein n=1 Tax=Ostreobium quekettii TaxID=121088 RepID=A0A8S1JGU4_9CHLO|nr:unnamed protein product [Ostreobium quekettii]|eukprot:evm.model.scf_1001EXC.7 EVM.evm.TU.scf_1001EXC.7   scf_1001EXC:37055-41873(+)